MLKGHELKPETRARLARERREERERYRMDLRARLAAKAAEDPDGIWQEMLDEHDARNER